MHIKGIQAGAATERIRADARYAVGYGNTRQTGATRERTNANTQNAVGYGNACQGGTTKERPMVDGRDAVGYDYDHQTGVVSESVISYLRYRFPFVYRRYDYVSFGCPSINIATHRITVVYPGKYKVTCIIWLWTSGKCQQHCYG
jgi:hypothetical protein